jgi:hypothetical protein
MGDFELSPPDPVCFRCSKPITPGTAAQRSGRAVHMRCLAGLTRLATIELEEQVARDQQRAKAAVTKAPAMWGSLYQTHCPVCQASLASRRGVLFQGNELVHADCWRASNPSHEAS